MNIFMGLINMKLIHYASCPVTLDYKKIYYDDRFDKGKPNGLWVSAESDAFGEDNVNWKQWCESEDFEVECLAYAHLATLKSDANILLLESEQQIIDFTQKYRSKKSNYFHRVIDWIKVKSEYQGIIIAPYQWNIIFLSQCSWYYVWDCSGGCIWDLSCIDSFELQNNNK